MSNGVERRVASSVLEPEAPSGMSQEKRDLESRGASALVPSAPQERKRKECLGNRAGTHHPNPKQKEE